MNASLLLSLTIGVTASGSGTDHAKRPICGPLPEGVYDVDWSDTYVESVSDGYPNRLDAAPTVSKTAQHPAVWSSLVTLPESPGISFYARKWTGPLQPPGDVELVTLENPVLAVTWFTLKN